MGFALSLVTQCLPITKAGRFLRKLNEVLLVVNEVGFFCLFVFLKSLFLIQTLD